MSLLFKRKLTHSTVPEHRPLKWGERHLSELALSEVEGVNPACSRLAKQALAFRPGSRRVDIEINLDFFPVIC
jgi:hypothetical protein